MGYVDTDEQVKIPVEIFEWELAMLNKRLNELPSIHQSRRIQNGNVFEVIRWKTKEGRFRETRLSKATESIKQVLYARNKLLNRKNVLTEQITNSVNEKKKPFTIRNMRGIMDGKFFERIPDRCLEPTKDKQYKCNGYYMRSRAEMHIGEALISLGLPFKYEVNITDLGDAVDFLVYIPSLDCCFILEFFGIGNNYKYMNKTSSKLICAFNSRYRLYYEYVFMAGDENSAPSKQEICSLISVVVANLCQERMVYK